MPTPCHATLVPAGFGWIPDRGPSNAAYRTGNLDEIPSIPHISGFTLVELLTVVSILGVLAALLLPAVLHSREKARAVSCLSNHRQVVLAWNLYASEHEDGLVPNPDSDRLQGAGWVVGNLRLPAVATNLELMANPRVSLLAPYLKDVRVYKCPNDESEFIRSIAMNCRLNPTRFDGDPAWLGGAGTNYAVFRRLGDIRNPSEIFVILDERSDSINDAYFAVDLSNTGTPEGAGLNRPYYMIDYPADYHDGAATVSFADGHVAAHEWMEKTTKPPLGEARPRSYTSPTDRDVQWLQEHCTVRK